MSTPTIGLLTTEEGFKGHVVHLPSGMIIIEWIPEATPAAYEEFEDYHQSVYHDWEDMKKGTNIATFEKQYP